MRHPAVFPILIAILALAVLVSLGVGARGIPVSVTIAALIHFDPDHLDHAVIRDLRLPRTLAASLAGAGLAVAGTVMQAITRNPLADPGLLGVNAGAALAVVCAAWLLGVSAPAIQVWFALPGAGIVALAVYALGTSGRRDASPVRLALAGAAFSALTLSLVSAIILTHQEALETYRFWLAGSVSGVRPTVLRDIAPFILTGLLLAFLAARALNSLQLGEETAQALGVRLGRARLLCFGAITLACGASVALIGPVGFLGLIVPPIARSLTGADMTRTLCAAALLGPAILIGADVFGRFILTNGELEVGIAMALIGGPAFIAITRRLERAPG